MMEKSPIMNQVGHFNPTRGSAAALSLFFITKIDSGKISEITPRELCVNVHPQKNIDCGCNSCIQCSQGKATVKLLVKCAHPENYSINQIIWVRRVLLKRAWAAFFIFGTPIVFAFASLLVWNYFSSATTESAVSIFCACVCFIAGFFVVALEDAIVQKIFPPKVLAKSESGDFFGA